MDPECPPACSDDTSRSLVQCKRIGLCDVRGVVSHSCPYLVHIECRREFLGLRIVYLTGGEHIVVCDTVRIDHLIYYLPLFGIGFDAELDRLHHSIS